MPTRPRISPSPPPRPPPRPPEGSGTYVRAWMDGWMRACMCVRGLAIGDGADVSICLPLSRMAAMHSAESKEEAGNFSTLDV